MFLGPSEYYNKHRPLWMATSCLLVWLQGKACPEVLFVSPGGHTESPCDLLNCTSRNDSWWQSSTWNRTPPEFWLNTHSSITCPMAPFGQKVTIRDESSNAYEGFFRHSYALWRQRLRWSQNDTLDSSCSCPFLLATSWCLPDLLISRSSIMISIILGMGLACKFLQFKSTATPLAPSSRQNWLLGFSWSASLLANSLSPSVRQAEYVFSLDKCANNIGAKCRFVISSKCFGFKFLRIYGSSVDLVSSSIHFRLLMRPSSRYPGTKLTCFYNIYSMVLSV
jgi:hypothetical protein